MCGIAAIFSYKANAPAVDRAELLRMRESMISRGPDGAGLWIAENGRIGLAHRRLAVIDLSDQAAQPMHSADGRLAVVFNGEIYNYRELRDELSRRGHLFRTQSDTEVLLHLYDCYGPDMAQKLRGMFAFALWDERRKRLLLARDPYGIKPLYYSNLDGVIRVASQVKALTEGRIPRSVSPAGLVSFFLLGYVLEPHTIYKDIRLLPAGAICMIQDGRQEEPKRYFSLSDKWSQSLPNGTPHPPVAAIREALLDSLRSHYVADIPVCIFLSGGIDSGVLAGLSRELGVSDLIGITLGFREFEGQDRDELLPSGLLAKTYGVRHIQQILNPSEVDDEIDRFLGVVDQPSVDGLNTYFISRAVKNAGYKAVLSGVGGDELFGGYSSFREVPAAAAMLKLPGNIPFLAQAFFAAAERLRQLFPEIHPKWSGLLKYSGSLGALYLLRRSLFMPWELGRVLKREVVEAGMAALDVTRHFEDTAGGHLNAVGLAVLESSLYLRNQLLRDCDWAGMAHSVEIRTPYVDSELISRLAPALNESDLSKKKQFMAQVPERPLPAEILSRPKSGFSIPLRQWLEKSRRHDSWKRSSYLSRFDPSGSRRWSMVVAENYLGADRFEDVRSRR